MADVGIETEATLPAVAEPPDRGQRPALVIFPARMQDVQTRTRWGEPSTTARTRWMLGFHRRLVRRCEWLMLMPNDGFLPHTSQTAAMGEHTSF
jgi:hypothetical protein